MNLDLGDTRYIIEYAKSKGVLRNQLAYILATAYHETAMTMRPVRETLATSDKQAITRLDSAFAKGQLKWVKTPYWRDGWFGRGYVQLTHKVNYDKMRVTKEGALQRDTATRVLVDGMMDGVFTGRKLGDYVTLQKSGFIAARAVVNGNDRAKDIAKYAEQYDAMLKAEGYSEAEPTVEVEPIGKSKRLWTWITAALLPALGLLDWRVQFLSVAVVGALAAYAIYSMPQVRTAIGKLFE